MRKNTDTPNRVSANARLQNKHRTPENRGSPFLVNTANVTTLNTNVSTVMSNCRKPPSKAPPLVSDDSLSKYVVVDDGKSEIYRRVDSVIMIFFLLAIIISKASKALLKPRKQGYIVLLQITCLCFDYSYLKKNTAKVTLS